MRGHHNFKFKFKNLLFKNLHRHTLNNRETETYEGLYTLIGAPAPNGFISIGLALERWEHLHSVKYWVLREWGIQYHLVAIRVPKSHLQVVSPVYPESIECLLGQILSGTFRHFRTLEKHITWSRVVKLPWIFPGAPWTFNGAPGHIQGNFKWYNEGIFALEIVTSGTGNVFHITTTLWNPPLSPVDYRKQECRALFFLCC